MSNRGSTKGKRHNGGIKYHAHHHLEEAIQTLYTLLIFTTHGYEHKRNTTVVAASARESYGEDRMTPEPGKAMQTPLEHSQAFIDAYNRRDADALRSLLAPELEYVRPGPVTLSTANEVMAQYEMDWSMFERSRVDIRSIVEADDTIVVEGTISALARGQEMVVEAVVVHQWRNGRLIRYRAYFDPFPNL